MELNSKRMTENINSRNQSKCINSRNQSKYINLRKFHNSIKNSLLNQTVDDFRNGRRRNIFLFDVSVGRMGDYHSWNKAGIYKVFGIDPDEKSISEAHTRYDNLRVNVKNRTEVVLKVETITNETIDIDKIIRNYNIVSCQFSIHYFFENQIMFDNAMRNIETNLKPGGYFIGTAIDGSKLNKLLMGNKILDTPHYHIEKKYENYDNPFGMKYSFQLKDHAESKLYSFDSDEFLVSKKVLVQACNHFGLQLVGIKDFEEYPTDEKLDEHEKFISFMYFTFVFQKPAK